LTPTATEAKVQISLAMPGTHFPSGSNCSLALAVSNPGADRSVDLYVLLDASGDYWSYPSWRPLVEGLDCQNAEVAAGASEIWPLIPPFTMPEVPDYGPLYFYAAMFEEGMLELDRLASNGDSVEFWLGSL
jgi:hypothetical protein